MGLYDSSEVSYNQAMILRYKPDVLNQVGQLYIKQKKYNKAVDILLKAHRLSPDTTSNIEALALAYIHKKEYDKALSYADTLSSKDQHSPGASLIKLTVAAWKGDWQSARKHYLELLHPADRWGLNDLQAGELNRRRVHGAPVRAHRGTRVERRQRYRCDTPNALVVQRRECRRDPR